MAKKYVHVVPEKGGGWKVTQGGKQMSGHRTQQNAIEAAQREAKKEGVELITHARDGKIRSHDSYVVAYRVVRDPAGAPSVSAAKIAAAAREIMGAKATKGSATHAVEGRSARSKRVSASGKSTSRVSSKRRVG